MRARARLVRALSGSGILATSMLIGSVGHAAADSSYECTTNQTVLEVNHDTGAITKYTGTTTAPIQNAINQAGGNVTPSSASASGSGDTVVVCHGTYTGDIGIPQGNDYLTLRSIDGSNGVKIVGDGKAPVIAIDNRGLVLGGPAEGFTISVSSSTASAVTGIQEGVPGAQATANEDETCTTAGMATSSGCDTAAPAAVTENDLILDNVFTNFKVPATAAITGIQLDNTINSTVQQNLFQNVVPGHSGAATVAGIIVGSFNQAPPSPAPAGYTTGDSTNINTGVLQNALTNLVGGANSTCSAVNGIELDGFSLDSTVYNNLLKPLISNDDSSCSVTGIFSDAYGSLENEQTGTITPVNANIDDNLIQQVGPASESQNSTGILLAPTPTTAAPPPQAPPQTCTSSATQNCNDNVPPSSYTVVQNEIQSDYKATDDEAVLGGNSYIRDNNFDGDAIGVKNGATPGPQNQSLDATNNWWGCELNATTPPPPAPGTPGYPKGCVALVSPSGDTAWAPTQSSAVEGAGQGAGQGAGSN